MKKFWIVVFLLSLTFVGLPATAQDAEDTQKLSKESEKSVQVFAQTLFYIEQYYLYNINLTECRYEILKRLSPIAASITTEEKTFCLDKHSYYYNPEEAKEIKTESEGHFGGIGATLSEENGKVIIREVLKYSPAEKSGLKNGDIIAKVRQENEKDGVAISKVTEAVKSIRGPVGAKVFLTINRNENTLEIEIVRDDIKVTPVKSKVFGNVGYVHIETFQPESTADDLEDALRALRNQNINRVILDLRNNPGGNLFGALETLYYFSKKNSDIMLVQKFKNREIIDTIGDSYGMYVYPETKSVKNAGEFSDMKIVVLVNKNSASASEIVAGTLQDWGRMVIGETTYGKGVGQSMFPLIDGSLLRLTTFEYLVGNSKKRVNNIGVKPDVEVKWEKQLDQDPQLKRALEEVNKL